MSPITDDLESRCSRCGSTVDKSPDLQILYTTCCGVALCTECTNGLFRTRRSIQCPECSVAISRASFDEREFSQQKYENVSRHRKLTDSVSVSVVFQRYSRRLQEAYSDHLEMIENVLYALSYGNPAEIEEAQRSIAEFKTANADRLTAQISQRIAEQNVAQDQARPVEPDQRQTMPEPSKAFSFPAPIVMNTLPKLMLVPCNPELDVDVSKLNPAELRKHKYSMWQRKIAAARAGGFRKGVAEERYEQDAFDSLFEFSVSTV